MTLPAAAPRSVWIAALLLSFAMAGMVVIAFLATGPSPVTTWLVPVVVSALAAFVFALVWPRHAWRWGLLLSSGFWLFFLVVFVAYLTVGKLDVQPAGRAALAALAGLLGAAAGTRLRRPAARAGAR